jgi:uncharacterized membrane protein YhaH (DUF805 family)
MSYFGHGLLLGAICLLVDGIAVGLMMTGNAGGMVIGGVVLAAAVFFGFWSVLALGAKRLHDIGHSGWLLLWVSLAFGILGAIGSQSPVVQVISLLCQIAWNIYVLFKPGTEGQNRFGPPPVTVPAGAAVQPA